MLLELRREGYTFNEEHMLENMDEHGLDINLTLDDIEEAFLTATDGYTFTNREGQRHYNAFVTIDGRRLAIGFGIRTTPHPLFTILSEEEIRRDLRRPETTHFQISWN